MKMRKHILTIFLFLALPTYCSTSSAAPPLADQLEIEAQRSLVQGQVGLSATLLRGAWELSHDFKYLKQLAQAQTMAGHFDQAIETYKKILSLNPPPAIAANARSEVRRLKATPAPFSDELPKGQHATEFAKLAFKQGLQLVRRKQLAQAIRYLRAALVLDPVLPGTYRVLGAVHGKLKDPKKEREFLQDYLRIRPDGTIADGVRKRLAPTGLLGNVALNASFPCDVWINGRPLGLKTPVKEFSLPEGSYTVSFVNVDYHIVRNRRVKVRPATRTSVSFSFGVLELDLNPWARARASGKELGLWPKIGLPVGTYQLSLVAHDMSKNKELELTMQAGKTIKISKW